MKLTIEKLGRIAHAELDIRPLTIFVGSNNTNKSWTAYALYALARHLAWPSVRVDPFGVSGGFTKNDPVIEDQPDLQQRIADEITKAMSLLSQVPRTSPLSIRFAQQSLADGLKGPLRLQLGSPALRSFFRLSEAQLKESTATLEIDPTDDAAEGRRTLEIQIIQDPALAVSWTFELEDPTGTVDHGSARTLSSTLQSAYSAGVQAAFERFGLHAERPELSSFLWKALLDFTPRRLGTVLAFPASRESLLTDFKVLHPKFGEVSSTPNIDFVLFLQNADNFASSTVFTGPPPRLQALLPLLEDHVLGGRVEFVRNGAGAHLEFRPKGGPRMPLHATSSLVRSIGGFGIYLQDVARPGDMLIIDEPEMNMHPRAQVAFVELLAVLVNRGVRIVMTTHSPYVIDHVNTLVEAARLDPAAQREAVSRLELTTEEALLSLAQVAAYRFAEDGTVEDIVDREQHFIDSSTFGDVTDRESRLYGKIQSLARGE